jgi:hypothetical protein
MTPSRVVRITTAGQIAMAPNAPERFVVCTGDGDRFDVIVGHRLNDRPLSRVEAYSLAGGSAVPKFKPSLDEHDRRRRREMI